MGRDKALWMEAEEEALLAEYAMYEEALHGGPRRERATEAKRPC